MKKIALFSILALGILALASCQKEKEIVSSPGEVIITASRTATPTRSFLAAETGDDGAVSYPILWSAPDKILVTYAGVSAATFTSKNTEPADDAVFTGKLPEGEGFLYGIYPAESGNSVDEDGYFSILFHNEQNGVEGSFDPDAFPAVAFSENNHLAFQNICGLVQFKVAASDVKSVALKSYGSTVEPSPAPTRQTDVPSDLVGGELRISLEGEPVLIDYEEVLDCITLSAPDGGCFDPEATYYMAVPPCSLMDGVVFTLAHENDGEVKTEDVFIKGSLSVERSKVHDAGILGEDPGEEPDPEPELVPYLEQVWALESDDSDLWTSQITAISVTHPDGYGMVRSIAMDDDYIYLPKSSAWAAIAAVSIEDPTVQVKGNVSGIEGGTFATSCARMIPNTDASVNGGNDILLVSNLTSSTTDVALTVYAYTSGISAAPVVLCQFAWDAANETTDWRRYGDRFFVTGSWQDGKLYFPSFNANKSVILSVANGQRTAVTQITAPDLSPDGIKDLTVCPATGNILLHNSSIGNLVASTGNIVNGWNEYSLVYASDWAIGTWGYNFFSFNGADYFAEVYLGGGGAYLEVSEDLGSLEAVLPAPKTIVDSELLYGGSFADCCVRTIGDVTYLAALVQDGGLYLYKLILKEQAPDIEPEPEPAPAAPVSARHRR